MYCFLLVFFSNFDPKTHRFLTYSTCKYTVTLKPRLGSLKVIENNYTIQSGTHDFLLTFRSNRRPISHRFRDKRRCTSKITQKSPIFPPPVYLSPQMKAFPWNFVSTQGSEETRVMGLSDGWKSFHIALAVLIQYRSVTATQPASHVAIAITLYAIASSLKIEGNIRHYGRIVMY